MAEVFLSYARKDNEDPNGWVLKFHSQLEKRMGSILGEDISVFLDQFDITGNLLKDEIEKGISKAEILVALLSPWYLTREWCEEERELFIKHLQRRFPESKPEERILVAIKRLLAGHKRIDKEFINKLPPVFRGQLFFEFYSFDKNDHLKHLDPDQEEFDIALNNLANKLVNIRLALKNKESKRRLLFVAETTRDTFQSRSDLVKEFESHGFSILPPTYLSDVKEDAERQIEVYLKDCELSIHMFGPSFGLLLPDSQETLNQLQYRIAKEMKIPMLIWVPNSKAVLDKKQFEFIETVRKSISENSDLIESSLQDFMSEVAMRLKEKTK
jgi:hypothetical protein